MKFSFVRSGCDIIVTATYQLSLENLIKECQLTVEQAEDILFNSVQVARKSIGWSFIFQTGKFIVDLHLEEEHSSCRVAASIGPYGAVLGDGSEFNGWYTDSMTIEVKITREEEKMRVNDSIFSNSKIGIDLVCQS